MSEFKNALKEINKITSKILTELLFENVPEFKLYLLETSQIHDEGVYSFMMEFAIYLSTELKVNQNSPIVIRSFKYINELGKSHNLEVLNILKVGILEILYTTKGLDRSLVLELLDEKIKPLFLSSSKYYY